MGFLLFIAFAGAVADETLDLAAIGAVEAPKPLRAGAGDGVGAAGFKAATAPLLTILSAFPCSTPALTAPSSPLPAALAACAALSSEEVGVLLSNFVPPGVVPTAGFAGPAGAAGLVGATLGVPGDVDAAGLDVDVVGITVGFAVGLLSCAKRFWVFVSFKEFSVALDALTGFAAGCPGFQFGSFVLFRAVCSLLLSAVSVSFSCFLASLDPINRIIPAPI